MFDFVQFGADINQVHLVPACVLCLVAAQRNATGATDRDREREKRILQRDSFKDWCAPNSAEFVCL